MKTWIRTVSIIFLIFFVMGCNNRREELERQNAALHSLNNQLHSDITTRDEYVSAITDSVNAIYASIEDLNAAESSILREEKNMEMTKKLTQGEIRTRLGERLAVIRAVLIDDHKRINELQSKLVYSRQQYTGLTKLVESLRKSLQERDQSIADLTNRIRGLQADITQKNVELAEKSSLISQKDSVLALQQKEITTVYYITGTKSDLEKKGIIRKEGGFLWGMFGATTVLTNDFDKKYFKPINRTIQNTIQVEGKINEIIPKRNPQWYLQTIGDDGMSTLNISYPEQFWKDEYLVIVTDRPGNSIILTMINLNMQ
ncbi:MAG: hypothetical protein ACHQQQ_13175 [Bacteroidota bacterium]